MNISSIGKYNYSMNFAQSQSSGIKKQQSCPIHQPESREVSRRDFLRGLGMMSAAILAGCAGANPIAEDRLSSDLNKRFLYDLEMRADNNPIAKFVPGRGSIYESKDDVVKYAVALSRVKEDDRVEQPWKKYPDYMPLEATVQAKYEKTVSDLKDALLLNYLRQGGKLEWLEISQDASDADLARVLLFNIKDKKFFQNIFTKDLARAMVGAINDKEECPGYESQQIEKEKLASQLYPIRLKRSLNQRYLGALLDQQITPKFVVRTAISLMERDLEKGAQYCDPPAFDELDVRIQNTNWNTGGGDGGGRGGSGGSSSGGNAGGGTGGGGGSSGGGGGSSGGGGGGGGSTGGPSGGTGSSSNGGPGGGASSGK